jgi:hypothetical protein
MRPDVEQQFTWSNKFMPLVKQLVGHSIGPRLLTVSSFEEDTKQATDLKVLKNGETSIAVRIRKHQYLQRYGTQFTIRSLGRGGAWTEFDKVVVEGWGDFIFYGFSNEAEDDLAAWFIGDLGVFRSHCWSGKHIPSFSEMTNKDGTRLAAFDVRDFPTGFICSFYNDKLGTREIV